MESNVYNTSSYAGKTCTLRIKLTARGMYWVSTLKVAIPHFVELVAAAKLAKNPKPPAAVSENVRNSHWTWNR
ncbi:cell envelope integrity TolA C-terminal domain-containing protein [Escherichia coli]